MDVGINFCQTKSYPVFPNSFAPNSTPCANFDNAKFDASDIKFGHTKFYPEYCWREGRERERERERERGRGREREREREGGRGGMSVGLRFVSQMTTSRH